MRCVSCASMAGRYLSGSCGWTDMVFDSRRSVLKELQQRPLKSIFEHDMRRFMASLRSSSLDACPRPLPRAVHAQFPLRATTTPLRLSFSVHHLFFSLNCSATHRTTLCFLFRFIINAFLFPQSFRVDLHQAQSCLFACFAFTNTRIFQGYDKRRPKVSLMAPRWLRACLLMLLCVSPIKHSSSMMQTTVTQKTITNQLQNTSVSRFAAVQDQGQALEYKRGFSNSRTSLDSGCRRKRG